MATIMMAKDFSKYPGGRYKADGPYSAEHFRDDILIPVLESDKEEEVSIVFTNVRGLPSSFLEEVFGGLVRKGFKPDSLIARLRLVDLYARDQDKIVEFISSISNVSTLYDIRDHDFTKGMELLADLAVQSFLLWLHPTAQELYGPDVKLKFSIETLYSRVTDSYMLVACLKSDLPIVEGVLALQGQLSDRLSKYDDQTVFKKIAVMQ